MTDDKGERDDVASFAAWCMGSAHGDWDPRVEAEHQRVLTDAAVYEVWRGKMIAFEAARRAPLADGELRCGEICVDRDQHGEPF